MTKEFAVAADTVIAVLTYRRNDDLSLAIPHLVRAAATITPRASVLVVDNDPAGGAESVALTFAGAGVRYVNETTPGIAAARNRALRDAGSRFVAFIDDDMYPDPTWLSELVRTQAATGAAVVAGPVLEDYEIEPDSFITAGRFFVRRRLPTGTALDVAASGNMLLDVPKITALDVEFDDRFGLLGGSDHLFTRTLARRGAVMVWCDEAIAHDRVPAERMTREWALRRAYRVGNSQILVSLALSSGVLERWQVRAAATVGGLARVLLGTVRSMLGRLTGSMVHRARGSRLVRRGAGMIAAAWGSAYAEYARPLSAPATARDT